MNAQHCDRIGWLLDAIDEAENPDELNISGYSLHKLTGNKKDSWSLKVSGNWRITFRFDGGHVLGRESKRLSLLKSPRSKTRKPTHPGAILREDVLPELKITQQEFADRLGVSRRTVSEILHERRPVTPDMAIRLGKLLGNDAGLWLRMQQTVDLWALEQQGDYAHFHQIKAA